MSASRREFVAGLTATAVGEVPTGMVAVEYVASSITVTLLLF